MSSEISGKARHGLNMNCQINAQIWACQKEKPRDLEASQTLWQIVLGCFQSYLFLPVPSLLEHAVIYIMYPCIRQYKKCVSKFNENMRAQFEILFSSWKCTCFGGARVCNYIENVCRTAPLWQPFRVKAKRLSHAESVSWHWYVANPDWLCGVMMSLHLLLAGITQGRRTAGGREMTPKKQRRETTAVNSKNNLKKLQRNLFFALKTFIEKYLAYPLIRYLPKERRVFRLLLSHETCGETLNQTYPTLWLFWGQNRKKGENHIYYICPELFGGREE